MLSLAASLSSTESSFHKDNIHDTPTKSSSGRHSSSSMAGPSHDKLPQVAQSPLQTEQRVFVQVPPQQEQLSSTNSVPSLSSNPELVDENAGTTTTSYVVFFGEEQESAE
jgi:hypothetical protein